MTTKDNNSHTNPPQNKGIIRLSISGVLECCKNVSTVGLLAITQLI